MDLFGNQLEGIARLGLGEEVDVPGEEIGEVHNHVRLLADCESSSPRSDERIVPL